MYVMCRHTLWRGAHGHVAPACRGSSGATSWGGVEKKKILRIKTKASLPRQCWGHEGLVIAGGSSTGATLAILKCGPIP